MERHIYIDGEKIPVSEEIYHEYTRPVWREQKRRRVRAAWERSLEGFADAGFDIPTDDALLEDIVVDKALPIVAHRRNRDGWLITMRAADWFTIYREWEAGVDIMRGIFEGV